jgi:hypothetical protein
MPKNMELMKKAFEDATRDFGLTEKDGSPVKL